MKKNKLIIAGLGSAAVLLSVVSCGKLPENTIVERTSFSNSARVQVFNAIVGSNRNYLYVDGRPVNGAAIGYGTAFPASANSFFVDYGSRSFLLKDTLPATTQVPMAFAEAMGLRQSYTIFAYDTITSPKYKMVPNNIEMPGDSTARMRFANFLYANPTIAGVDVYSVKRKANIFSNITKTSVTPFIPFASSLSDTLLVRAAGTTTLVGQLNGFSPTAKRSYTVILRGGTTKAVTAFPTY